MKPSVFDQIAQSNEIILILKCKAHVSVLLYLKNKTKKLQNPDLRLNTKKLYFLILFWTCQI